MDSTYHPENVNRNQVFTSTRAALAPGLFVFGRMAKTICCLLNAPDSSVALHSRGSASYIIIIHIFHFEKNIHLAAAVLFRV